MNEREIKEGDFVFELFEDKPRVLKVLKVKNGVVTAETELGVVMANAVNFRLATTQEIKNRNRR